MKRIALLVSLSLLGLSFGAGAVAATDERITSACIVHVGTFPGPSASAAGVNIGLCTLFEEAPASTVESVDPAAGCFITAQEGETIEEDEFILAFCNVGTFLAENSITLSLD